ncbi:MAG: type III secretion system outer membrane ring subunit SctC [Arsenophonus endosymbiont of Dermacentor nuttalli]
MKRLLIKKDSSILIFLVFLNFILLSSSQAISEQSIESGYIAKNETVRGVFDALSSVINKPIVVSPLVAKKKITGDFDLKYPLDTLKDITQQLNFMWYDNGQVIYICDAVEMRSIVITLYNTTIQEIKKFLKDSGLYDERYPLRSGSNNSLFYISGPPVYIETIINTTRFLDEVTNGFDGREKIAIVPLYNTFVEDRHYQYRFNDIIIPGMASIINKLMDASTNNISNFKNHTLKKNQDELVKQNNNTYLTEDLSLNKANVSIISNPGNNSLLIKGDKEQVNYLRKIIKQLDITKRHIELSVWIIDIEKKALEQLGIKWSGGANIGQKLGISINAGTSTIDGASFMADIFALTRNDKANIVSRPMVLTQENIPAIFDNNRTFYTKLIGERTTDLKNVTYGTAISVLARFTIDDQIEMMITVQDGSRGEQITDHLPEIGRTDISTIARVPQSKSLLIGGYTRNEHRNIEKKIPLLGDIPYLGNIFRYTTEKKDSLVRVFLIQPKEIINPLSTNAENFAKRVIEDKFDHKLEDWMTNFLSNR